MKGRSRRKSRISAKSDFRSCRREISRRMGTSTQRTPSRAEIFFSVSSPEATPTTSKLPAKKRSCPRSRPSSELATVVSRISFGRRPSLEEALCSGKSTIEKHSELPIRLARQISKRERAVSRRADAFVHALSAVADEVRALPRSGGKRECAAEPMRAGTASRKGFRREAQRIGKSLCFLENHVDF